MGALKHDQVENNQTVLTLQQTLAIQIDLILGPENRSRFKENFPDSEPNEENLAWFWTTWPDEQHCEAARFSKKYRRY